MCVGVYIRGHRSHYNLYAHRDGAKGRAACPRRAHAIAAGFKLPKTSHEEQADNSQESNEANGQSTLDVFLSQPTFNVDLCNTVLVIWIILHASPFNRFYDAPLRAAFKLANRRADLRTPTWASGIAKDLYLNLSSAVIDLVAVRINFICPSSYIPFLLVTFLHHNSYLTFISLYWHVNLFLFMGKFWKVLSCPRCLDYKR